MSEAAENEIPLAPPIKKNRTVVIKRSKIPTNIKVKLTTAREKQIRALELRKAKVPYHVIAEELGYASPSGAKQAVDRAIRAMQFEAARDVVMQDLMTLDEMQMRCMDAMRKGDLFQVDRLLRIMERRYMLVGLQGRTVEELQEHFGIKNSSAGMQNNGVMVINAQAGSADFVRSMMQAVGVDPDSPEAQKKLKELEAGPPAEPRHRERIIKKRTVEEVPDGEALDEGEIVDAEIIDDED